MLRLLKDKPNIDIGVLLFNEPVLCPIGGEKATLYFDVEGMSLPVNNPKVRHIMMWLVIGYPVRLVEKWDALLFKKTSHPLFEFIFVPRHASVTLNTMNGRLPDRSKRRSVSFRFLGFCHTRRFFGCNRSLRFLHDREALFGIEAGFCSSIVTNQIQYL